MSDKKKKINKLAKELREKDTEALKQGLLEAQKNVFALRTQAVTQKLENPNQAKAARKQIARIKTLIRERQIAAASGKAPAAVATEAAPKAAKKAVKKAAPAAKEAAPAVEKKAVKKTVKKAAPKKTASAEK